MSNSLSVDSSLSHGGSSLSTVKRRAVLALVEHGSVSRAADTCNLSRQSLYRWLREPEFERALREASSEQVIEASRRLTSLTMRAVDRLEKLLDSERELTQLKAVESILTHGARLRELVELEERITNLERSMERGR